VRQSIQTSCADAFAFHKPALRRGLDLPVIEG
jgi:hypothetical protein